MGEENKFAIKEDKKAGKSIIGVIFIIIFIIIFAICVLRRLNKKEDEVTMPLAAIDTIKMGTGDIYLEESVMGTILPTDTYYVINKVAGEITNIYVKNGDYVRKGDPICDIDNQKQIDGAYIQYDTTKSSYERMEKLYESGDISKQNFETVKAQYDAAKLSYDTQVEFATPVATGDGYVENTDMTLGVTKNTGSILCYITSDGGKDVQFAVSERVLDGIRIGDNITIEKQNKTYNATIYDKASLISQSTGLFNIKASIEDENDFPSGIMAKVTLYFDESLNTNILPRKVIYYNNELPYVYVLNDDSTVTIKNVILGLETNDEVEILSGLNKNDKIIATWSSELAEGTEVNEISSSVYQVIKKKDRIIPTNNNKLFNNKIDMVSTNSNIIIASYSNLVASNSNIIISTYSQIATNSIINNNTNIINDSNNIENNENIYDINTKNNDENKNINKIEMNENLNDDNIYNNIIKSTYSEIEKYNDFTSNNINVSTDSTIERKNQNIISTGSIAESITKEKSTNNIMLDNLNYKVSAISIR